MEQNRTAEIQTLRKRIEEMCTYLRIEQKRAQAKELEEQSAQPGFWDNQEQAQKIMRQVSDLRADVNEYDLCVSVLEDAEIANELASANEDPEMEKELENALIELAKRADNLEFSSWFDGEFDHSDCIVTINPGQGGLEAQDWTRMLFEMYQRYCESKNFKLTINHVVPGEAIGLDRATFTVSGRNAYGMLKGEQGTHRLVRISPTDAKKRRHTTFGGVEVLPVIDDDIDLNIDEKDLRIDVYHASGHGGQGVNTTDSAVRITHIPTNTVVTCQNERSQLQNKECAMRILRSRLYELEKKKRAETLDDLRDSGDISWGNQIRNYVLYPYQLVKDLRSDIETGNVDAVLGGDLDQFIIGYHRWRVSLQAKAADKQREQRRQRGSTP